MSKAVKQHHPSAEIGPPEPTTPAQASSTPAVDGVNTTTGNDELKADANPVNTVAIPWSEELCSAARDLIRSFGPSEFASLEYLRIYFVTLKCHSPKAAEQKRNEIGQFRACALPHRVFGKGPQLFEKEKEDYDQFFRVDSDTLILPIDLVLLNDFSGLSDLIVHATSTASFCMKSELLPVVIGFLRVFDNDEYVNLDLWQEPEGSELQVEHAICREAVHRAYVAQMQFLKLLAQAMKQADWHHIVIRSGPVFFIDGQETPLPHAPQRGLMALALLKDLSRFKDEDLAFLYDGEAADPPRDVRNIFNTLSKYLPRMGKPFSKNHIVTLSGISIKTEVDDAKMKEFLSESKK